MENTPSKNKKGKLYLFPVPIGAEDISQSLPEYNKQKLNECNIFIVEELRTARRFLKKAGYTHTIDDTIFYELNEHTKEESITTYLSAIDKGENIGLLSEAGVPCVADPGAIIVAMAQAKNIVVEPLVGPSSLLMALMASGFNGQNFAFVGYLPIDKNQRIKRIKELETLVYKQNQTQIFIEAPYRNNQLLATLLESCNSKTYVCVACDIQLPTQLICSQSIEQWKKNIPDLHKRNTVFLLYK